MALKDDLATHVNSTFGSFWTTRDGQKVPGDGDIKLSNDGVHLDGVVLYADLTDSTGLVLKRPDTFAAEIYKAYVYCAARIIGATGTVTAYDGDRVMGVFIGESRFDDAVTCALQINGAVQDIIQPKIVSIYKNSPYSLRHKVAMDSSKLLVANTGVRGNHDLVWVGNAANNAAKIAALKRTINYTTYVTKAMWDGMGTWSKVGGKPFANMWTNLGSTDLGYQIFGSNWYRRMS